MTDKSKTIEKNPIRPFSFFLILWFVILAFLITYTIWDNQRVRVVQQEVTIKNLPSSFSGYRILLISDLHAKRFGKNQKNLVANINSLDYDVLFFAGDMQSSEEDGIKPLLEIIQGLDKKTPIYYVSGNWDSNDIDSMTGEVLEYGKVLQTNGVTLLTLPEKISKGSDHLWIVPYFSYTMNRNIITTVQQHLNQSKSIEELQSNQKILEHQTTLLNSIKTLSNDETIIGLMHVPLAKEDLDDLSDLPPYDLALAGHFHGGQIRLPFFGAFYVPDHYAERNGFFPDNKYISGLIVGKETQQYISRGLGATAIIPLLQFRFLNTPEINLITLK